MFITTLHRNYAKVPVSLGPVSGCDNLFHACTSARQRNPQTFLIHVHAGKVSTLDLPLTAFKVSLCKQPNLTRQRLYRKSAPDSYPFVHLYIVDNLISLTGLHTMAGDYISLVATRISRARSMPGMLPTVPDLPIPLLCRRITQSIHLCPSFDGSFTVSYHQQLPFTAICYST